MAFYHSDFYALIVSGSEDPIHTHRINPDQELARPYAIFLMLEISIDLFTYCQSRPIHPSLASLALRAHCNSTTITCLFPGTHWFLCLGREHAVARLPERLLPTLALLITAAIAVLSFLNIVAERSPFLILITFVCYE